MYLKTLELTGFKSFPDKTVISFEPGITAIVGANGSGKSNISDAVRWVLGEMSPKSLRSSKMEDVIFNGTAKRRPANYAEVVITIDNSDSLMKIDYDEVSVARKLYRSGESEYFINKQKCRLKDVVELFLNTGIGREGYSIISQGRISEIISVKGSERRDIFEEAAGISRFRYRKTEANARLLQVNENSQRIQDILSEVEGRLPSLEKQSEKATKYMELAEEKKRLEIAFWAQRLRAIEKKENEVGAVFEKENAALEKLNDSLREVETGLDAVFVETQKKNLEVSSLTDAISADSNEKSEISGRLSVLENDVYHFSSQMESSAESKKQLAAREKEALDSRASLETELEKKTEESRLAVSRFEDSEKALARLAGEGEELAAEQDRLTEQAQRLEGLIQEKELSRMEKKGMELAQNRRLDQIAVQLEQRKQARAQRLAALDGAEASLKELEERQDGLLVEKRELRDALKALDAELEDADSKKRDADLRLAGVDQRRETLKRMERLLEGFSGSVKEVMNAFERGELSGIYGPVSRLITTDQRFVTAVETALGGGIQNVVVADDRAAKAAIKFLKRTRSGRATFLPLTTLRPNVADMSSVRHRGFLGNAAELVKYDKIYEPAVKFLLGRTAVAEDIESAAEIAASRNYGLRVVTLDGQIVNAGGSFTGGQTLKSAGMLSRNADIKRLDEEYEKIKKDCERLAASYRDASGRREKAAEKLRRADAQCDELREELVREENRVKMERELLADLQRGDEALAAETETLKAAGADQKELLNRLEEENTRLEREAKANSDELDANTGKIRALNAKREELLTENSRLAAAVASAEAAAGSAREAVERADAAAAEVRRSMEELNEGERTLQERIAQSKAQIGELSEELKRTEERIADSRAKLDGARIALADLEKQSFEQRARQKDLTLEKDRQTDAVTSLKIKLDQFANEKEGFITKLREEYELDRDSEEFLAVPSDEAERLGGEVRLIFLRKEIKKLGNVNLDSVQEYKETRERYDFLKKQFDDVVTSRDELQKLILNLEKTMREMFVDSFEKIRAGFKETFTALFGGGSADIVLTDPEDILNCGIEINVQPPGKLVKNLSLLSGGEQAFVAIALYFAILKVNPTPFCIFDEIESALDEANIYRYADYLRKNCDKTQFVVITHRRGTMEFADVLYGITMQEKGVSDFIRLDASAIGSVSSDG